MSKLIDLTGLKQFWNKAKAVIDSGDSNTKTAVSNIYPSISLSGDFEARIQSFETAYSALTGSLDGARFVGILPDGNLALFVYSVPDGYYVGLSMSVNSDFSEVKRVIIQYGNTLTETPITSFSADVFKAISLQDTSDDPMGEIAASNHMEIETREANFNDIGISPDERPLIPILFEQSPGYISYVSSEVYVGIVDGGKQIRVVNGKVSLTDLGSQVIHDAGTKVSYTLPEGITKDDIYNLETKQLGTSEGSVYSARILTTLNADRSLKQFSQVSSDNGSTWSDWVQM